MKSFANRFIPSLLLCFMLANFAIAQETQKRDLAKEEKLWQQLQKIAPRAVETFKSATLNLDQKKYPESIKLYKEVLIEAPDFDPALRRLGYGLIETGKREEGLTMSQKAVSLNRTPENLLGLAFALAEPGPNNYQATVGELKQALALSKEAMQKDTENDSDYAFAAAQFALMSDQTDDFREICRLLSAKFPSLAPTHYFNAIRLAEDGDWDAARAEIKKSEVLGLPREAAQQMLAKIEDAENGSYFGLGKYFYYGVYLISAWVLGLLLLFVSGKILSARTLHSIENSNPNDITGGGQAGLRKIYKNVIGIAGIYYYISQPIVILLVIVAAGGITLFFLWLGRIPVKLLAIVLIVGLVTIFYMIKSLFVRAKMEDPGRAINEAEAPELWALVRDVAKAINTRPVDEIRLTHGTELAVYERGRMREKMQDKAERILIIGAGVLGGFSQNAFRAVLAHEYGHFSNRDTAGGTIAMRVNLDIVRLAEAMALSGMATHYNIAFQFLRVYHFLFRRITHGATRLQEILADRVAVHQYGAEAFREGLSHVIRRSIEFDHVASKEINAAFSSNRALQNLYEMTEHNEEIKQDLEQQFNENIRRPTTEDDTHPSPEDRFRWANQIKSREIPSINGMVWDLFKNKESLTNEMNTLLEKRIRENL